MYLQDYFGFMLALLICGVFSAITSAKVHKAYGKYGQIRNRSGMTGYDTVHRLMWANGISGISIGKVNGKLSDHYNPAKAIVNLSEDTYDSNSIGAVAVAAHEMGHIMQKHQGYWFYKLRTALVPVVNFGSRLSMPLVLIGLLMDMFSQTASNQTGFYIAMIGVILYGGSLVFTLVTLPVELNASRRAKKMLLAEGILSSDEMDGASEVLSAAALTYVASLMTSLVYFLRFLVRVLTMFGRRDNN